MVAANPDTGAGPAVFDADVVIGSTAPKTLQTRGDSILIRQSLQVHEALAVDSRELRIGSAHRFDFERKDHGDIGTDRRMVKGEKVVIVQFRADGDRSRIAEGVPDDQLGLPGNQPSLLA